MDAKRFAPALQARVGFTLLVALVAAWAAFPANSRAAGASADFSFQPPVALVGQAVTFTAVGIPASGAAIASYRWDLNGDGTFELNTGLVPTTTTTYLAPGTFTVQMQMRDSWDNRITKSRVLTVGGQPPLASFAIFPAAPLVNEPVAFSSTSNDPDGEIVDQAWDLNGDGSFDNGGGPTAFRSFSVPGQYVVGLRVTDNESHSSFASRSVSVAAAQSATGALPRIAPVGSLLLMNPFPVVRISGSLTRRGARLRLVAIDAPSGSTVRVRCAGRSCPYRTRTSVVSKTSGSLRMQRLERSLRAGVKIRIYVTSPGTIGKYTYFRIRRGTSPSRTDACVGYGSTRPVACHAY